MAAGPRERVAAPEQGGRCRSFERRPDREPVVAELLTIQTSGAGLDRFGRVEVRASTEIVALAMLLAARPHIVGEGAWQRVKTRVACPD